MEGGQGGLVEVDFSRNAERNWGIRIIEGQAVVNSLIIEAGTETPCSISRDDYTVVRDGQEFFELPIVQYEDDGSIEHVKNYRVRFGRRARKGDGVTVTLHYSAEGVISADALDRSGNTPLVMEEHPFKEPEMVVALRPRWVLYLLDISYSMEGEDLSNAKNAIVESAQQVLGLGEEGTKIGVVTLGSYASVVVEPTQDAERIESAVGAISCHGTTAMDQGIQEAVTLASRSPSGTERLVVLVTDGIPDDEDQTVMAAARAKSMGIELSNLALPGANASLLGRIGPVLELESSTEIGSNLANLLTRAP